MKLSPEVKDVITAFAVKFPLAKNDEDSRIWTHKLCEQLAFSFPYDGWGHKSAGPGRPHSADAIALQTPFICWDVIFLSGTPEARLSLEGESINIGGQIFEPVTPTNHIGATPPPPPTDLEVRVRRLEADVAIMQSALRDACTALERI